jgi:hypothetical protein
VFFDALGASGVAPATLTQQLSALGLLTPARGEAITLLSAGSSDGPELRLVVAAEAVGWDLRRVEPGLVRAYYDALVVGAGVDAVVDSIDPSAAFTRSHGGRLDPDYAANAMDATRFFLAWSQSGAPVDAPSYLRMNAVMHAIMAAGPDGDRNYAAHRAYDTRDVPWGRYRVQLDPANASPEVAQYLAALGIVPDFGRVDVPGIPPAFQAYGGGQLLAYPQAGAEVYFAEQAVPWLNEVLNHPAPGSADYEAAMARFFHATVSAHFFDRVNLSLVQSQMNGIRALQGLEPIVIDNLDMVAQRLGPDEFVALFQQRAAGELPFQTDLLGGAPR